MAGTAGGEEQLLGRIEYDEIDLLLFFRDTTSLNENKYVRAVDEKLLLMCDKNNVPLATNIATAEVLILALDRGDLAWRELVNPRYNR
jgi:methylglyoxal synthase